MEGCVVAYRLVAAGMWFAAGFIGSWAGCCPHAAAPTVQPGVRGRVGCRGGVLVGPGTRDDDPERAGDGDQARRGELEERVEDALAARGRDRRCGLSLAEPAAPSEAAASQEPGERAGPATAACRVTRYPGRRHLPAASAEPGRSSRHFTIPTPASGRRLLV
ncbi:hypothetical protein [Yinghuangia seranimata]|uniref:hypothetical protein n=1 Tax=Yinghuangia seranimata TaxID=408067 RepID=UPI00248AA911|nr:hypothetical protein [Yinghuangia seranimata]MDI2126578.1 hypothetical protein [Yinghuangia seranimata]